MADGAQDDQVDAVTALDIGVGLFWFLMLLGVPLNLAVSLWGTDRLRLVMARALIFLAALCWVLIVSSVGLPEFLT